MGLRIHSQRLGILVCLLLLATGASSDAKEEDEEEEPFLTHTEKQRYDGWYNNLAHPDWGSIDSQLTRKAPPSYLDGVYQMAGASRPGARALSQALMKGRDGLASRRNLTVLFTFFGQVAASEVLMASESGCPIEVQKIEVGECDDAFDKECRGARLMPFHRALYDHKTGQSPNSPREQLNQMTSWIDGSFVYSTSEAWVNSMRTFENGTFRSTEGGFPPRNLERVPLINYPPARYLGMQNPERMFLLGDPRIHQNPALLSLGVVFHRWHNVMAERVRRQHPDWADEDVFQRARRWVIATLQNIILYEYLPLLLMEPVSPYQGYQPDLHPGVSHVFQSAAFRFGHTLIPPGLYKRNALCEFRKTMTGYPAVRLCSTWWDSEEVENGIEELLMGMASQIAEREDNVLCSDVRDKLFGPMDFSRRDLAALNIMRGRDNGLPDYNTVRRYFQLPEVRNWTQINPPLFERNPELFGALDQLYGDRLDDVDLYIGGMLETELEGRPGPLFRKIIRQQFERIRDADRFWFENTHNGIFSESEVSEIRSITLWDVLVNTTGIEPDAIQRNVFTWAEGDPCPQPKQLVSADLEPCLMLSGYDYFHGNEVTYIYSCILLAFIPIACAGVGYGVIKLENRRRRMIRMRQEVVIGKHCEKLDVKEWLHNNHKRCVKVKIGPDDSISTLNRKGETLRKVDFRTSSTVVVEVTDDPNRKPMVLVRSPRDHDLTFGLRPGEKRHLEDVGGNDVIMVMRTSLSKLEFAEALGMRPESLFVKNMFNCVDKDKDGRISFQEFLDTVVLFSRGKTEDKLRIVFDMCDDDGNGVIDKRELMQMLRSLVDIAKTNSLDEVQVMDLIQGMFEASGLQDKEELGYEDFKLMMREYKGDFIAIGLDCKGAKQNFLDTSTNIARMTSFQISRPSEDPPGWLCGKFNQLATFLEEYRQHIFYLFVFYVVTGVLFLERFVFYSYFAEHTDLRHVMGLGIAVTRGSAAALSFCYSLLLLTMCRNLITKLRELPLHQYVPLDSYVQFHKVVALTALFFSMIHTVGHCINFYHVSTQPVDNLRCLTKEVHFESSFPNHSGILKASEIHQAEIKIVKLIQEKEFDKEIKSLKTSAPTSSQRSPIGSSRQLQAFRASYCTPSCASCSSSPTPGSDRRPTSTSGRRTASTSCSTSSAWCTASLRLQGLPDSGSSSWVQLSYSHWTRWSAFRLSSSNWTFSTRNCCPLM
ncbi:unnamed protein product [Larinioides sclopetarius]|uniref:NAD(P)H oxidase (H2O2-forming) n=1 Tax=Larinioides sclopetarius TaxID=280406 RepID=A0AAV2AS74_9ARAC